MQYFRHDADAHTDVKLRKLMMAHGIEGYGLYWYILELITKEVDEHHLTFELEHDSELLAHDTGLGRDRVEAMVKFMVQIGLFEASQGTITCLKLLKRLDTSMTSNVRLRKLIKTAREKVMTKSGNVLTDSDFILQEKNIKEKNIGSLDDVSDPPPSSPKRKVFVPPDVSEVRAYCRERKNNVDASTFCDFYEAKGWVVGKTKMKDWKAAVRTWEKRDSGGGTREEYSRRAV